jgi:hypothetical protein
MHSEIDLIEADLPSQSASRPLKPTPISTRWNSGCNRHHRRQLAEVLTGRHPATEAPIQQALADGWLQAAAVGTSEPALPDLDEGEAASIRLALTSGPQVLLLIDERGLIASARDVFAALHANDFRISPAVIQAVLDRCGE